MDKQAPKASSAEAIRSRLKKTREVAAMARIEAEVIVEIARELREASAAQRAQRKRQSETKSV